MKYIQIINFIYTCPVIVACFAIIDFNYFSLKQSNTYILLYEDLYVCMFVMDKPKTTELI